MPQLDARAISRIAQNPGCFRQAAMHLLSLSEQGAYTLLTGIPYPGPRGERTSALQWGRLFEVRLTEHQAGRLLASLDCVLRIQPARVRVRDLRQEVPDSQPEAVLERCRRTRVILTDLLAGRRVPDLLLQPALQLSWDGMDWGHIVPDALVLDRAQQRFVPLETKAYISLDGMLTPGERIALRLQAAVEVLALRSELRRLDPGRTVPPLALLVVATPFGFRPAPAVLEELEAELAAVEAALRTLGRVFAHLATPRQDSPPRETLTSLPHYYQESCLTGCALAGVCRTQTPGARGELGDHAASLIGEQIDLARVIALLSGAPATTPEEAQLLASLQETATLYQWNAPRWSVT
jgi:hypothetical protein